MAKNACCVWDFTLPADRLSVDELKIELSSVCKKWCFQLEKGLESGFLHYQGRVSLGLKTRTPTDQLRTPGYHFSVTSLENQKNLFYVMKDDGTRIDGPWKDDDKVTYVPIDIREITKLLPWQETLHEVLKKVEYRKVTVVWDADGNSGKSTFVRWSMCHGHGQILPFVNDFKDMMRMVMSMDVAKCYFIDMPKAINKEKLYQFFGGVEMLKTGYAYDDRYTFKQRLFDPPQVVIFTNVLPDARMLSIDRWRVITIVGGNFVNYTVNVGIPATQASVTIGNP